MVDLSFFLSVSLSHLIITTISVVLPALPTPRLLGLLASHGAKTWNRRNPGREKRLSSSHSIRHTPDSTRKSRRRASSSRAWPSRCTGSRATSPAAAGEEPAGSTSAVAEEAGPAGSSLAEGAARRSIAGST